MRWNVLQMFFFNLVERKVRFFTNKQYCLTLQSFRQFQNLSKENMARVAEDLIELYFSAFLRNKSKKCLISVWIIFQFTEIIAKSILPYVVWAFWQETLKSQWTVDFKFCEFNAENFKATFLILLA